MVEPQDRLKGVGSMTIEEKIELLEKEKAYMLSHGGDKQAIALDSAIKALKQESQQEPKTGHWTKVTDKSEHFVWECDKMVVMKLTHMKHVPEFCDDCTYYSCKPHPYKGWSNGCELCMQCLDDDQEEGWIYDGNSRPKNCPLVEIDSSAITEDR